MQQYVCSIHQLKKLLVEFYNEKMQRFSILFCFLAVILYFSTAKATIQNSSKPNDFVEIELSVSGYGTFNLMLPTNDGNTKSGSAIGGVLGCADCSPNLSKVSYGANSVMLKNNKVKVYFQIYFNEKNGEREKIEKSFTVSDKKKIYLKLNDEINLTIFRKQNSGKAN